jgi:CheY-like chemotaxis protein
MRGFTSRGVPAVHGVAGGVRVIKGGPMTGLEDETAQVVYSMYEVLAVCGDAKSLSTSVGRAADDFNDVLARAQGAFPYSRALRGVEALAPDDTVVVLLSRLSVVKAAIDDQRGRRRPVAVRPGGPKVVRLPIGEEAAPSVEPAGSFEYDLPDLTGVSVLLAEHTTSLRELLRTGLAQCGAAVDSTGSVEDALLRLATRRPHIVLFDARLEDAGVPLAAAAQAQALPVIAVTARDVGGNLETLLAAYHVRLLRTFDPATVAAAVKNAIAES